MVPTGNILHMLGMQGSIPVLRGQRLRGSQCAWAFVTYSPMAEQEERQCVERLGAGEVTQIWPKFRPVKSKQQ